MRGIRMAATLGAAQGCFYDLLKTIGFNQKNSNTIQYMSKLTSFAKMFFEAMLWITELIHWTKNNWLAWFSLKYIHNCCSQNCDQGLYSLPFIRSWLHLNASGRFTWSLQDYGKFCISRNLTNIYPIVVAGWAADRWVQDSVPTTSPDKLGANVGQLFRKSCNSLLCWPPSIRHWLVRKWWNTYSTRHHFSLLGRKLSVPWNLENVFWNGWKCQVITHSWLMGQKQ